MNKLQNFIFRTSGCATLLLNQKLVSLFSHRWEQSFNCVCYKTIRLCNKGSAKFARLLIGIVFFLYDLIFEVIFTKLPTKFNFQRIFRKFLWPRFDSVFKFVQWEIFISLSKEKLLLNQFAKHRNYRSMSFSF